MVWMKGLKYAASKYIKNKPKPVVVEKKKKSLTSSISKTIDERRKKYMGGESLEKVKQKTLTEPKKYDDLKKHMKESRFKYWTQHKNKGGKVSSYYKKGGNVITGR